MTPFCATVHRHNATMSTYRAVPNVCVTFYFCRILQPTGIVQGIQSGRIRKQVELKLQAFRFPCQSRLSDDQRPDSFSQLRNTFRRTQSPNSNEARTDPTVRLLRNESYPGWLFPVSSVGEGEDQKTLYSGSSQYQNNIVTFSQSRFLPLHQYDQ